MTLFRTIVDAIAHARDTVRAGAMLYAIGGPVGLYHAAKIAHIKRRLREIAAHIDREKDLHREHLRMLNHEATQLVMAQQETSVAAAQFWNWCEKKAGVR